MHLGRELSMGPVDSVHELFIEKQVFYARLAKNKQKNHPYNKGYHKAIIEPLDRVHKICYVLCSIFIILQNS